ncbi:MAG: class I SAM-dependent methyltransferase [Prolixibacteraceae bacterium]|nr:class I SAM-dependent methyltransferase [Prolixibacteraceae bacterium]
MKTIDYKSDQYHKDRHPEFLKSETLTKAWSEFAFNEYFKGEIKKDILEFGGGLGHNLIYLANKSDIWMIEPSDLGRKYAEKFGIKTASSIPDLKLSNSGKYDIILCRHVLEHVDNPLQVLLDLKSLLKPDGELILVLPVETKAKPVRNEIDFHQFCWTPRTAINLLKNAEFEDIEWK